MHGFGIWRQGAELVIGSCLLIGLALPAILPVLVVPWGGWRARQEPALGYLALITVAMVISAFPRADVMHLAFFVALPMALGTILVARWRGAGYVAVALSVISLLYVVSYSTNRFREQHLVSPLGMVRTATPALADVLAVADRAPYSRPPTGGSRSSC